MKPVKLLGLVGLAAAGLFAGQAMATTCPMNSSGAPTCIASNSPLQAELNAITTSGTDVNIFTDQFTPSSTWSIGATGNSENTLMFEMTNPGGSGSDFGIYDPSDSSMVLSLFTTSQDTAGDSTSLRYDGGGKYTATYFDSKGNELSQSSATFAGNNNSFGYYLMTSFGTFYSDNALNQGPGQANNPYGAGGMHQMVAYEGNNSANICITKSACGTFLSNEFILAWTGSPFSNSNLDYNDFVAMVESVHPVPEPDDLALFGLGVLLLGGLVALEKRREARRSSHA